METKNRDIKIKINIFIKTKYIFYLSKCPTIKKKS